LALIENLFGRFLSMWCGLGKDNSRARLFFFIGLIAICGITVYIGAVPTMAFGHDDFFVLENGWHALFGQVPHLDFWSPWGPVSFLVTALGLKLGHESANGLGYGTAVAALLIGLWIYFIGRNRMAPAPRAILALYSALLICAPYPLGFQPMLSAHAMSYNRLGYALLAVVILECFQRLETEDINWEAWIGGFSTGAAAGLELFLKASYFLIAAGLIVASFALLRTGLRRTLAIIAGFAVISFAGIAYLRFEVGAVIHAFRMAAGARSLSFSPSMSFWEIMGTLSPLLGALSLAVAASFLKPSRREWLGDLYLPALAILFFFADAAILTTNQQGYAMPLMPMFALLVGNRLAYSRKDLPADAPDRHLPYYVSVLLLCGLLFLPQFCSDAEGLAAGAVRKSDPSAFGSCSVRFSEPRLAALILCDQRHETPSLISNGSLYTKYVNDGTALLRKNCNPADRVLTMDMQNPFPYALGWPPPRGGIASTSFNYTFSEKFGPSFDAYFGDATVVMLPKRPAQMPSYIDGFYKIYVPALQQRFRLAAESDWFWLYKRK
jgi:hypothetical protein